MSVAVFWQICILTNKEGILYTIDKQIPNNISDEGKRMRVQTQFSWLPPATEVSTTNDESKRGYLQWINSIMRRTMSICSVATVPMWTITADRFHK